jgi:hypothetical protein
MELLFTLGGSLILVLTATRWVLRTEAGQAHS